MLQIKGIRKVYKTGSLVQEALKGVSLSLRDNEFVAILGQSGSGKTTMLNIIGGLDRYDEGDLIINGVSTKRYSDRDWDSYRNHTVGFVFQSYNLIPHQTVLRNVELALTISGIGSKERTARATEALQKVGLSEHIHKKPSQLSGGQMQRVAIARALVNDPDILLADEPTGALDSDTSIQVMDLLKEVAQDRLVVMVTHNPELAETYATRIVTLKDGEITSDSDPFTPEEGETIHKNLGKSSMSLLTALSLSFKNLWTKKARTVLVAFAGSIGIIGIAMILSMSHGANQYIRNVEEESLQDYPLQITDTTFNLTSMYADRMAAVQQAKDNADRKDVEEFRTITTMLSGVSTNDLKSLKAYFESDECDIDNYVQTIEYDYNLTPRIYKVNKNGDYRQVNPDISFTPLGFTGTESSTNGMLSSYSSADSFFAMPEKEELYKNGFDLKAGEWPQNYDECVVALSSNGNIPDITLYAMGLKDPKELDDMVNAFAEGKDTEDLSEMGRYNYEDLLGVEFRLVSVTEFYTYDKNYKVWSDRSSDKSYMKKLLKNAEKLKIVGVVQPNENNNSPGRNVGIGYHYSLTNHIIDMAKNSDIVKAQLDNPDIDVFTGKRFDDESSDSDMDMNSLFSVDTDAINEAFSFDSSNLDFSEMDLSGIDFSDIDFSSAVSMDDLKAAMPELGEEDIENLLSDINFNIASDTLYDLFNEMLTAYQDYIENDKRADITALPSALWQYLNTEEAQELLRTDISELLAKHSDELITEEELNAIAESYITGYANWLLTRNAEIGADFQIGDASQFGDDFQMGDASQIGSASQLGYDSSIRDYINSDEAKLILAEGIATLREKMENFNPSDEELGTLTSDIISGYETYADENDLPSASYLLTTFTDYLATSEAVSMITEIVNEGVDTSKIEDTITKYSDMISTQIGTVMQGVLATVSNEVTASLQRSMATLTSNLSDNLLSAFQFDPDALADMFKMEMTAEELKDLMVSMMSTQRTTLDGNLKKLGYADLANPTTITIYPTDFDSKEHIKAIISDYNDRMKAAGDDDKVIEYTDLVDALMGSVTTIIDAISYVLIAFVAISLIVSSIMIGVITYISVLERKKEIGILRAIGASKRNISQVFNAETFIIGALAGVIGIGVTQLLIIPANAILHALTEQENINAILPPAAAGILIILSIMLTLIGGIIPSRKAAKSDPVAALRSE